ncbi:MAG: hypothetical protein J0H40_03090 [Rhizobiales bacterium]|nr:hypothetical protein [Hyphomicrobiales bacterium]
MRPLGAALTAILIAAMAGGCSLGGNGGAFAQLEDSDITGSLGAAAHAGPTETDLAFARTAASDVLTKGAKDASQPWENPSTGARGSVTPLAEAYMADGRTCRGFLASYVNGKSESWLEGAACRSGRGQWEIQSLKPWRRG